MISMMEQLRRTNPKRMAVLIYGVRNSAEMAFADRIRQLTAGESNAHAIRCFSRPLTEDVSDGSFEVQGHVTIDLLKQVLPDNQCQFYLCGAPAFMQSLYEGLVQWEVPETQIFFEAFGPASVNRKKQTEVQTSDSISAKYEQLDPVTFSVADKTVLWSANHESLLELAEAHDIFPDSGCRAGSCGSCETALIRGKVAYPEGQSVDCPAGACLICVAKPDGPVELEL
jgi:ferredoxin-NADP reductase